MLRFANCLSLLVESGPFLYLLALGMQLFIACSLFVGLLITPAQGTG